MPASLGWRLIIIALLAFSATATRADDGWSREVDAASVNLDGLRVILQMTAPPPSLAGACGFAGVLYPDTTVTAYSNDVRVIPVAPSRSGWFAIAATSFGVRRAASGAIRALTAGLELRDPFGDTTRIHVVRHRPWHPSDPCGANKPVLEVGSSLRLRLAPGVSGLPPGSSGYPSVGCVGTILYRNAEDVYTADLVLWRNLRAPIIDPDSACAGGDARIVGQPVVGRTLTCGVTGMTGITGYAWFVGSEVRSHGPVSNRNYVPSAADAGRMLQCEAAGFVGGEFTNRFSPAVQISAGATSPSRPKDPLYVAMGDSFSSGEGAVNPLTAPVDRFLPGTASDDDERQPGAGNTCHRSAFAYPYRVRNALAASGLDMRLVHVACSGAETIDLRGLASPVGQVDQMATLRRVGAQVRLVTIGIGGNDLFFADILKGCIFRSRLVGPCRRDEELADRHAQLLGLSGRRSLLALIAEVHALAPAAQIVLVDYPDLAPYPGQRSCASTGWLSANDVGYIRDALLERANGAISTTVLRAQAAGFPVTLASVRSDFMANAVCSARPFANGVWLFDGGYRNIEYGFHPNVGGHDQMARTITAAILSRARPFADDVESPSADTTLELVAGGEQTLGLALEQPSDALLATIENARGVGVRLVNPDGVDAAAEVIEAGDSKILAVQAPPVGTWTLVLSGQGLTETVTVNARMAATPLAVGAPPIAGLSVRRQGPTVEAVAVATPGSAAISSFRWAWGDGTADSTGSTADHTYATAGSYDVTLSVAGADGMSDTTTTTVTVGAQQLRGVQLKTRALPAGRGLLVAIRCPAAATERCLAVVDVRATRGRRNLTVRRLIRPGRQVAVRLSRKELVGGRDRGRPGFRLRALVNVVVADASTRPPVRLHRMVRF